MINYTFIIPHKDIPDLLRRCVSSIPRRDDIEIIIVDDASDPEVVNERTMADVIEQPCVRMIFTKENRGLSYVRNVGVGHATGKWIFIADADDFLMPGALEMLDKYKDSDAEVVCFHICAKDCYTQEPSTRELHYNKKMDLAAEGKMRKNELLALVPTTWSKMVRRSLYLEYNITYQETTRIWTDLYCSRLIALYAKNIEISPDILYCVTDRSTNMTHTFVSKCYLKQMYHVTKTTNRLVARHNEPRFVWNIAEVFWRIRRHSLLLYWRYFILSLFDGTFHNSTLKYTFKQRLYNLLRYTYWMLPKKSDFKRVK